MRTAIFSGLWFVATAINHKVISTDGNYDMFSGVIFIVCVIWDALYYLKKEG